MERKTIILTGASSGIGYQLCLKLAEEKHNIVIAARSIEKLEELAEKCKNLGADILTVKTDVSVKSECENLIEEVVKKYGNIDILINNAGIGMNASLEEVKDLDVFKNIMDINYFGTVYCSYYALKYLIKSKGLIVGISSLQGKTGFIKSTGYVASKWAMQGFLESLRIELKNYGVDISIIYPGPINTEIKRFDAAGKLVPRDDKYNRNTNVMPLEECVRQILKAIKNRQRETVMTFQGKLIPWIKLIAPGFLDKQILKAVNKFYY